MFETELKMIREYLKEHPREAAARLAELPASDAAAILADQPAELKVTGATVEVARQHQTAGELEEVVLSLDAHVEHCRHREYQAY